jgi:hypothetical protein
MGMGYISHRAQRRRVFPSEGFIRSTLFTLMAASTIGISGENQGLINMMGDGL